MRQIKLIVAGMLLVIAGIWFASLKNPTLYASSCGPPPERTGAPGEGTCLFCHNSFIPNHPSGSIALSGLAKTYTPGEPIDFTVTISHDGTGCDQIDEIDCVRKNWGFQLTVLDAKNRFAGTLVNTDDTNTQIISGQVGDDTRYYIEQTCQGTFFNPEGAYEATWSMRWIPPESDVGPVTFYVAGNAANGDGDPAGDFIFTTSQTVGQRPP